MSAGLVYYSLVTYPYLVSMFFSDLLSLHLVTFLMFFILGIYCVSSLSLRIEFTDSMIYDCSWQSGNLSSKGGA